MADEEKNETTEEPQVDEAVAEQAAPEAQAADEAPADEAPAEEAPAEEAAPAEAAVEAPATEESPAPAEEPATEEAPAAEAPVISCVAEWAIEPRRRDFQRVRRRHHVLDIQHRTQIATDPGAIVDADTVFGRRCRPRPIEPDPQHHSARLAPELDVEDVEAVRARHPRRQRTNLFDDVRGRHATPAYAGVPPATAA